MKSMTGFGAGHAPLADGRLTIEIRAVNHRHLELRVRTPSFLPDLATVVESLARDRLTRGRFDISVRIEGRALGAMVVDRERARSVFAALDGLRAELAPGSELPLSLLGAVPALVVPAIEQDVEALHDALARSLDQACLALDDMRRTEGEALRADLTRRLATLRACTAVIAGRTPEVVDAYRARLSARLERLLAKGVSFDAGRLEQELVIFADRIDIAEELTRLESHAAHFAGILASNDAVGRRLDFLLQELAREVNTIGAKSQDVAIAHAVVDLKTEIDRMREQVQNVE